MELEGKKIILGVCGSIAAYKSLLLLRLLTSAGAEVQIIMTPDARKFVGSLSFASLSSLPVLSEWISEKDWKNHVDLGLWGDLLIIAPATAQTLAKLANGMVDNLLTAVYLSAKCPVMVAPAMDLDMWAHAATQSNIKVLQSRGVEVIPVGNGPLASGLVGEGRLAEPNDILKHIFKFFERKKDLANTRVLVTAGPTQEALDPIRYIGNRSTGKMGIRIAESAAERGAIVTLVLGPTNESIKSFNNLEVIRVQTADQMMEAIRPQVSQQDYFILAAAVADFKPEKSQEEKIKKNNFALKIELVPTPDIALYIGQNKKSNQKLVGFALETQNILQNAQLKMNTKNMDMIVINNAREEGAGFGVDTNRIDILKKNGEFLPLELKTKKELSNDIIDQMIKL